MSDLAHGLLILLSAYYKQKLVHAMRVFFNQRIYNIQLDSIYMWFFQGPVLIHYWPDFEEMEGGQSKQLVGQGKKNLRFELSRKDVEKTNTFLRQNY